MDPGTGFEYAKFRGYCIEIILPKKKKKKLTIFEGWC